RPDRTVPGHRTRGDARRVHLDEVAGRSHGAVSSAHDHLLHPGPQPLGIPPFSGFIGKVALFLAGFDDHAWLPTVLIVAGTVTSLLTLYVIGRTFNLAFWRDPADVEEPNEDLVEEFSERKKTLLAGRKWTS